MIVTTFIAPPLLKIVFRGDEENPAQGLRKDTHGMIHGGGHT